MLEHDYLIRKDKDTIELGGVVIGLALNSVHYYREMSATRKRSDHQRQKLRQEGEKSLKKWRNGSETWMI
ncbi:CamS family sex pheromone protein [Bacillus licheniformis]|nr:CamS family sex pheromone protein [Bacillus licheniformis]